MAIGFGASLRCRPAPMRSLSLLVVVLAGAALDALRADVAASCGCSLALGSFYITWGLTLTEIASRFGLVPSNVTPFNNNMNPDVIIAGSRIAIPLGTCDCLYVGGASYAAHSFPYVVHNETYYTIATQKYANLTTADWLAKVNSYPANRIPNGATINVTINCSCGDASVSTDYGLFETYPLRSKDNLASVAKAFGLKEDLLQGFNPGLNFNAGTGIAFVPVKDLSGSYRPLPLLTSKEGISGGAIAGIAVAVVFVLLLLAICLYYGVCRKKSRKASLLPSSAEDGSFLHGHDSASTPQVGSALPVANRTVEKSVEFSYEELAKATNDFSMTNKIGGGGFGEVYYAELRGEKAAIKKMDMQASKAFLAELKVLTHVHHLNLVRLIGYCTESSLFLVYEFIENGNLSEHLRGSGRDPLPWSVRVQIALDSARGLEYIHEHTVPMYIHRDIKSANILIDKSFHAKVADFGLAKLTEVGSSLVQSRLVGTFGYMPPEYAQYGEASPKVDVYAFGVVLYELISAREAVVNAGSVTETRGLVAVFNDVLSQPDPREELKKIVDPRLGDNYPIDSVHKIAHLAKACTQENPQLRPSMQSIVVALMTLSSSTEDLDVGSFYDNQALMNLMSGR